jgi:hypothetical protein
MFMGYYGGPPNGAFDTQTTLGSLKCKIDDLQQIVNQILPGSVPIPASSSTNNISLPISATEVTWSDPNTNNTPTLQYVLELIKDQISLLESKESSSSTEISLPISATDVNCTNSDNEIMDLQSRLNSLHLQILNAQSSGGSGSSSGSGSGSNIILPLLSSEVNYYSDVNNQIYSLSVFLNSLELKIIELQNAAPAESGSGLSIEQEEKLDIIGIPHALDNRLFLDPAYSIQYLLTQDYKDPVLNFTDRIRLQRRDPYLPIDIKYDSTKGALVIKMNTPEIILPDQFQVRFDPLEDSISFIRPNSPYNTTDEYYKATLKFGTNSQKVYSHNVDHNGTKLYNLINNLQTEVEELKTKLANLNTDQINHTSIADDLNWDLHHHLNQMKKNYTTFTRANGDTIYMTEYLKYLESAITQCFLKASGSSVGLPVMPPALTPQEVIHILAAM